LISTSRTPNARPRPGARWLRVGVRAHLVSGTQAAADERWLRATGVGAGLVALVGLTAWAVASVSVWWVPAYLALMVLIFVTPRGRRPLSTSSQASAESVSAVGSELWRDLRADGTDGVDQLPHLTELDSGSAANEPTEPSDSSLESVGFSTPRARRGRVRARKAARTAAQPMPDPPPVIWIQIGPGKFVRVESSIQAVDQVPVEKVTVGASPATDLPIHLPSMSTVSAEALAAQDPPNPLATMAGDVGMVIVSDDCVAGSVTKEYGIAPSAFSPAPLVTSSVEGLAHDASGVIANPEADPSSIANLGGPMLWRGVGPGPFWSYRRLSRWRAHRVSPIIGHAIPGLDRVSSRRDAPPSPNPRTSVRAWFAPNARRQQAAHRAFGRIAHVERALRPRSPPYLPGLCGGPALPAGARRRVTHQGIRPVEPARRFHFVVLGAVGTVRIGEVKDQLDRASTSTPFNIAEGNGKYAPKDRCRFFDIAHGSTLEWAAGLDILVAKAKLRPKQIRPGKASLQRIVWMRMGLIKRNSTREYVKGNVANSEPLALLSNGPARRSFVVARGSGHAGPRPSLGAARGLRHE